MKALKSPYAFSYPAHIQISNILQSDKIVTLTGAAGVELEPIWATLLAKALEGKNVKELLSNVGSGGGAPAAGSAPAAGGAAAAAEAPKEEEKKEEEKEESDDDMVGPFHPIPKPSNITLGFRSIRLICFHIVLQCILKRATVTSTKLFLVAFLAKNACFMTHA